jgi:hypothetical protein
MMFHNVNSRKGKRAQSEADQLEEQSRSKESVPNLGVRTLQVFTGPTRRSQVATKKRYESVVGHTDS